MPKMTDSELISVLNDAKADAVTYNGEFMKDNQKFLSAYYGLKEYEFTANPEESSVVSTDIADVVEADMPSLMRVFTGSGDIISFEANTDSEAEQQEAQDKTKYVNWVVKNQSDSFKMQYDWLKDAEIQKFGVVKYFVDESTEVEEVEFEGLDQEEIQGVIESLRSPDVKEVKILEQEEYDNGTFDIKFKVKREKSQIKIVNVPTESFIITRNARSKADAPLVGDIVSKTRSELIADGFKRELVESLPSTTSDNDTYNQMDSIRNYDQGGESFNTSVKDWANEEVEIYDLYVKLDYDGDGIAERRHVMISGNRVLINESFNHVPYAMLSAIPMPHKAIGRSRAEITYQTQLEKTALKRGLLNNIYQANAPRNVVHDDVDLDDMLTMRTNGLVRLDSDSKILPQQAVFPLVTPYTGDRTLQVLQYVDQQRAQTSGTLLSSQGLSADTIAKETATRFNGIEKAGSAKIELICRNYAETGYRDLFEGIAWLASRFQDTETEFMVLGKAMRVDPRKWKYNHSIKTNVGLGAGNNEALIESLQGIYQIQTQLKMAGSTLADESDIYNTLKRITDGLGLPRVDEFFNNPEEPNELLKAQNEQLNAMVMQMQQQIQQMQNPLAESEQIKAQASLIKAQGDAQVKMMEMQQKQEQFAAELREKQQAQDDKIALELTKLEVENRRQLNGEFKDNGGTQ